MTVRKHSCLREPMITPDHAALLRACLGQGEVAEQGLEEWRAATNLDDVDSESHLLLPLLGRALAELEAKHCDAARLRGVHRYWWTKNQLRLRTLQSSLRILQADEFKTMVVGTTATALRCYSDAALRPLPRCAVMVPNAEARRAIDAFVNAGYGFSAGWDPRNSQGLLDPTAQPGVVLSDPTGEEFELRWHLLPDCLWTEADEVFWDNAQNLEIQGLATTTPCDSDIFLEICCPAAVSDHLSPIRIADVALMISSSETHLDWDRIAELARQRLLVLPVKRMLTAVGSAACVPLPSPARAVLDSMRVSWLEARDRSRRHARRAGTHTLTQLSAGFWRYHGELGFFGKLARVPNRLRENLSGIAHAAWREIRP